MTERARGPLYSPLDLLILKALALQPLHGVGISQRIQQMTQPTIQVSYGSLFPALHRMEEEGWLAAEWSISEKNRRAKYYRLTRSGGKQLRIEEQEWLRTVEAVAAALASE